ncbi:MAG: hypothetical protein V3V01_12100 [Acidimicrobiales bacterium]
MLLASAIALSACGGGSDTVESAASTAADTQSGGTEEDSPLSGTVPTLAGGQIDLGSLEGQDTILWFWASW